MRGGVPGTRPRNSYLVHSNRGTRATTRELTFGFFREGDSPQAGTEENERREF